ncbi:hypothetical protein [Streptomyces sp. 8L]|uniref:hypothetical protein n=1 Tax=Streptomyces sp. 8L TaxID=2877242 RepID=UPI001CD382DC|nr:hypothetical protein [Streptomyces sp. 8L]MCA1223860.1 hypothetical protein [Streptomyces sp. 8L]
MNIILSKRAVSVIAGVAMLMGGASTIGASAASAATAAIPSNVVFYDNGEQGDGSRSMSIYINGNKLAGAAYWVANGDKLQAVDPAADGYGIAAYLSTSPVREASTYGHNSPYTATKTGNLPENHAYKFWACVGGSAGQVCSNEYSVTS